MEKVKRFLRNKKYVAITVVVVLALSLPFVVNQVLQQQRTQQHADSATAVDYKFDPATSAVKPNDTFPVDLVINAGTNDVGSMEFTVKYDKTLLQPVSTTAKGGFTLGTQEVTDAGYHVILLNTTKNQITGTNITTAEITFKALKEGTATVTIDNTNDMHTTASLFYTYVPAVSTTTTGTYTISDFAVSPSEPPQNNCNVSTQKPGGCSCASNSECQSGACIPLPPTTQTSPTGPIITDTTTPSPIPNLSFGTCAAPAQSITPSVSPTEQPTETPMPTPTIDPNNTALNVSVTLLGISSNPNDNHTPLRPSRQATIEIFDAQNKQVGQDIRAILTFDSSKFEYDGMADLGPDFTTGQYTVKIKLDNTLYKRYPGIITITQKSHDNKVNAPVQLVTGDINQDNILDIKDWTAFVSCYKDDSSCTATQKTLADANDNGVVKDDSTDLTIIQRGFLTRNGD